MYKREREENRYKGKILDHGSHLIEGFNIVDQNI